jgi:hypothetical protein
MFNSDEYPLVGVGSYLDFTISEHINSSGKEVLVLKIANDYSSVNPGSVEGNEEMRAFVKDEEIWSEIKIESNIKVQQ